MLIKRRSLLAASGAAALAAPSILTPGVGAVEADLPGRRELRHARRDPGRVRQAQRHHATALRQPLDPGPGRSHPHRSGRLRAARRAVRGLCQQREAAAAHRDVQAQELGQDASAAQGRPGRTRRAARHRRQSRPHDVSRRGPHEDLLHAGLLPDGFDRLQRRQDQDREQRAVVGRPVQSEVSRQGRDVRHRLARHAECRDGHAGARACSSRST